MAKPSSSRPIRRRSTPSGASGEPGVKNSVSSAYAAAEVVQSFYDTAQDLTRDLLQMNENLQEQQAEALRKYLAALETAIAESQEKTTGKAYKEYVEAVQSQDGNKITQAQGAYGELLSKLQIELETTTKKQVEKYLDTINQALHQSQQDSQKQYLKYIDSLKENFANTKSEDLSPNAIAAIAQSVAASAILGASAFTPSKVPPKEE